MDTNSADNQNVEQPNARKSRKPVIAAVAGVVVLVLAIVGLNLAGFISLPFLPKSPEIVLLRALDGIAHDGTFDLAASGDTDAELRIGVLGQEETNTVHLTATATGTARDFDANDLFKLKIEDGTFTADTSLSLEAGFLKGETGNLHAAGTYDLIFGEGAINYILTEPFNFEGTITFDPNSLLGDGKTASASGKSGTSSSGSTGGTSAIRNAVNLGLQDIKNMKMEGDVITFTVNMASLSTEVAPEELLKGILQPFGIDVVDAKTELSDLDVRVDLSDANSIRAHATGMMSTTARGELRDGLPMGLSYLPLSADLALNIPIDIELVLS